MKPGTLVEALADEHESLRTFAAADAAAGNDEADVGPLVDRLRVESSVVVREALVSALIRMCSRTVCDAVAPLLTSDEAFVRNAAVRVLRARAEQALDVLERMLPAANGDVRKFIVDVASACPSDRATALLLRCLEDKDINVRITAVEALGERRAPVAVGRIAQMLFSEQEPMLLAAALNALETIGDEGAYEAISKRFPDGAEVPIELALPLLRVFANIAPPFATEALLQEAARLAPIYPADITEALEALQARCGFTIVSPVCWERLTKLAISASRPVDRFRLLKWVGKLRDQPGMVAFLTAQLSDPEPLIRLGAVLGLRHSGGREAERAVAERYGTETHDDVRNAMAEVLAEPPRSE